MQAAVDHQLSALASSHPTQRVSLVTFSDEVRRICPSIVTDREYVDVWMDVGVVEGYYISFLAGPKRRRRKRV